MKKENKTIKYDCVIDDYIEGKRIFHNEIVEAQSASDAYEKARDIVLVRYGQLLDYDVYESEENHFEVCDD